MNPVSISSSLLTIMDSNLGHSPGSYSSLYSPMANDDHHTQFDGTENDIYCSSDLAEIAAFMHPNMSDYFHAPPLCGMSYVSHVPYHPGNISTNQRQLHNQHLYIDTRLETPYPTNDSDGSMASSSPFHALLQTPYTYPNLSPAIHLSPQSAPADGGMFIPVRDIFKRDSPIPPSPLSHDPFDPLPSPLPPSDVETQAPMPHILEWKSVGECSGANDFVPQIVYQPYTEADRKRYIQEVHLQPTIFFVSDDPTEMGISLDDALKQRLRNLKDKDDRMFVGCGPSVSIRIQWPGYQPWSKQIPTKDFRNPKGPITRAKLAKNIATCIKHFTEAMQDKPMEAGSDKNWKVGERYIKVEDLILVSLHHVSKGSWQPQLRLRRAPFAMFPCRWNNSLPSIS